MESYLSACENGDYDTVVSYLVTHSGLEHPRKFENVLYAGYNIVCRRKHYKLVEYFLTKFVKDFQRCLSDACELNRTSIIKLIVKHLKLHKSQCIDASFEVCSHNNLEIVDLFISKNIMDFSYGIMGACKGGHYELVKKMLTNDVECMLPDCLVYACRNAHLDIIKLLVQYGANNWEDGFFTACEKKHKNVMELMATYGKWKKSDTRIWNTGLELVLSEYEEEIVEEYECTSVKVRQWNVTEEECNATLFLLEKGADKFESIFMFCYDFCFITRALCRLGGKRRKLFLKQSNNNRRLRKYLKDVGLLETLPPVKRKSTMHNILFQFTCADVATFSVRFQPIFQE